MQILRRQPEAAAVLTKRVRANTRPSARVRALKGIKHSWRLYVLLALPLLYLIVFKYVPMYGLQIAFRDYNVIGGFSGSTWVGLKHFQRFVHSYNFWLILRNTIELHLYYLAVNSPLAIALALGVNYAGRTWFRKSVQLISYAPHFISVVVMAGIIIQFLGPQDGIINVILGYFGLAPGNLLAKPAWFKTIYVWSGTWQHLGFACIIYLAALTAIDSALHEAAMLDGASKLQRIRYIDLPGIVPIAIILLILNVGQLLDTGFEKVLLLQNSLNLSASEVLDTYIYRVGLASAVPNFSYATAIGLFKSVFGLIAIVLVNQLARKVRAASLW